jgi:hypothetical protein
MPRSDLLLLHAAVPTVSFLLTHCLACARACFYTHMRTHAHTHAHTRRLLHSHVSAWLESCIVVGKTVIFIYISIHNHAQEYLFEHTRTHTYTPHATDAPSGRVCTTSIPSVNRMCHALADTHNPSACIQTQPASHKCTPLVQRVVVSADINA